MQRPFPPAAHSALAFLILLFPACSRHSPSAISQLPLVKALKVEQAGREVLELRGSVAAEGRLRLGFKQPGVIGAILVKEGDRVRKGQTLALLDDVDAASQLRSATAALDRARREAGRAARLAEEGALPFSQREDARNHLEASEAQWKQAEDAQARTRLASPVSGTVFQRLAEPGETLAPGMPVLVLDTTERLVVKAGVAERDRRWMKPSQAVTLLPEDGGNPFPGQVSGLAASPQPTDGLYTVEITPDTGNRRDLRPGSLLTVRIPRPEASKGVRIPFGALVHRQGRNWVYVLENGGRTKARLVTLEKADGEGLILRDGLQAGEILVAEGACFLQDGQAVRIQD